MELQINLEDSAIYILKDGYNIIEKSIYNEELVNTIYNMIQKELED